MNEYNSKTLDLKEAAAFFKIHPVTLSMKAASGEIQGAKIGRSWVFLELDLVSHIRSKYKLRALEGEHERKQICHSTNAKTRPIGGSRSPSVDEQYNAALGLATKSKPRNITTR